MKKLLLLLLLTPFFSNAQVVNTILRKNTATKVISSYSSGSAGSDTLANVYKLPEFTEGQVPAWDATNKRFIASTVSLSGIKTFVFSRDTSDISGYEQAVALNSYVEGLRDTATVTATTGGVLMQEFATNVGFPNMTVIQPGEFRVYYETKKASGGQNYWTYAVVLKRSLAGTETVIDTTEISTVTDANTLQNVNVSFLVASNISLLTTDRLVVKVYAQMQSSTASIDLYYDDATYARLTIPSSSVDATNFVPYVGATKDLISEYSIQADSLKGNGTDITGVVHTTGNESVSGIKTFNNNLGIGKTPAVPLDVLGEISSTVNATGGGTNPTIAKFSAYQQSAGNSNYPAATFFVGSSASDLGAYLTVNPLFATGTTQIPSNFSLSTNYNPLQASAKGLFITQTNTLARIGTGLAGNPSLSATPFAISAGSVNENVRFFTNGNSSFGTTTDSGFKLNVNGTGRFSSNVTANSFIKSGGTSSQSLMADGSLYALSDSINSKQNSLSGTGIVKSVGGTISYLTDNSSNWNTAYIYSQVGHLPLVAGFSNQIVNSLYISNGNALIGLSPDGAVYSGSNANDSGGYFGTYTNSPANFGVNGVSKYSISTSGNHSFTGNIATSGALSVTDEAYGSGWNGSLEVPTKNAIYDAIQSGTYTPTLTNGANVASSTAGTGAYIRVGNQVTGWVDFTALGIAFGTGTFGISLPIASNFSSSTDVSGGAGVARSGESIASSVQSVSADTTNDRFTVTATISDGGSVTIRINFQYQIQ